MSDFWYEYEFEDDGEVPVGPHFSVRAGANPNEIADAYGQAMAEMYPHRTMSAWFARHKCKS